MAALEEAVVDSPWSMATNRGEYGSQHLHRTLPHLSMKVFQFSVSRLLVTTAFFGVAMAFYIESAELGDRYIQCLAAGVLFTVASVANLFRYGWIATVLTVVFLAPVLLDLC